MRYSPFLSCRQASRLMSAKLDRELTSLERVGLRLHLAICEPCRRYFGQMRGTIRFLAEGPPPPSPASEDTIMAALRDARRDP